MIDQKKYTLEDDLREAAGWLSLSGPKQAPLRDRLLKWAEGRDPNELKVDLRGIKVGDEVTFANGAILVVTYLCRTVPAGTNVKIGFSPDAVEGTWYTYSGVCKQNKGSPRIISYRTRPDVTTGGG